MNSFFRSVYKYIFLFIILLPALQFGQSEGILQQAKDHIDAGRYGEAIELLNRYITQNPRNAEGYYLRAKSYENRGHFQNSIYDYRIAIKLAPDNQQYAQEYQITLSTFHDQLDKKIAGLRRELAIDPNKSETYLEIGKAYKAKEEYEPAYDYYKQFLSRIDRTSPDEIIRFTEILGFLEYYREGEEILLEYTGYHPDDWRLWSRLGYFQLWLGKNRNAAESFQKALDIKPFFKEAEEGLKRAEREGFAIVNPKEQVVQEYPVDRYYRMVRNEPDNDEYRFRLVEELVKVNRYEEAYQQLQVLSADHYGEERFDNLWAEVTGYRDRVYNEQIDQFTEKLQADPTDKAAAKGASQYYEYLQEYDMALAVLDNYFNEVPNEKDQELRFQYGRLAAWTGNFDIAKEVLDNLLADFPDNLDYQLFRAQISVWTNSDMDLAAEYLDNVLEARPGSLQAVITKGNFELKRRDFEEAERYANIAEEIDASNSDVYQLQSNIELEKMRAQEEKNFLILEEGRKLAIDGNCQEALPYYEEYLEVADPNRLIRKEYADIQFCAENYNNALSIYDDLLLDGFDYDVAMQRAKVYYSMRDSLNAVIAFKQIVDEYPDEFEPRLYLADAYAQADQPDVAANIYDSLLVRDDIDSNRIALIEQRKGWLPTSGDFFSTFPQYVALAPIAAFYSDNLGFGYRNVGARAEFGATDFLTLGVSFYQPSLNGNDDDGNDISRSFTQFKGHVYVKISPFVRAGFGFGTLNTTNEEAADEYDAFVNYDNDLNVKVNANYTYTDAGILLYSPSLVDIRLRASLLKIAAEYKHDDTKLNFSGYYQYVTVGDAAYNEYNVDNEGNDFKGRIGYPLYKNLELGYEYYYSNYKIESAYYYSPQGFESHSLWGDWLVEKKDDFTVNAGGLIGYVPSSEFLIRQVYGKFTYKPMPALNITGEVSLGITSRDDSSYNYVSGSIGAYWSIY